MKPTKKKAKEYLFKELMERLKRKEDEMKDIHKKIFQLGSGEFDKEIEISSSSNDDKWYINIPCAVWTFVEK